MTKNELVKPVVKWVGGKRQLLNEIIPLIPKKVNYYCEPFFGGGAVLFELQPKKAIINDLNGELINMYRAIKDSPEELLALLSQHINSSEYFYRIRDLDRDKHAYDQLDDIYKASRIIYLNKTCYNGLFRVNSAGEFNTPFGNYKNPNIINEPVIRAVSHYLRTNDIEILSMDYSEVLHMLKKNSFVYLDPPYDPISTSSSFTGYNKGGFDRKEQIRLKEECDVLNKKGIKFLLSNSNTEFIRELYKDYTIKIVQANRAVNSNASNRTGAEEVLVYNYEQN